MTPKTSKLWIAAAVLVLAAMPNLAAKVFIDYDTTANLESYNTWAYKEASEGTVHDPLMDGRIVDGLKNMLSQGRLEMVSADPDLWATYTVTSEERKQYTTTSMGYGYGGGAGRYGRYGGGYGGGYGSVGIGTSSTSEQTYTDGTLIVDIWDARTKELVWRGSATDTLKANPEKIAKQIDKFYVQMMDKWKKTISKAKRDKEKASKQGAKGD